jgi:hypothetical protein
MRLKQSGKPPNSAKKFCDRGIARDRVDQRQAHSLLLIRDHPRKSAVKPLLVFSVPLSLLVD